MPEVGLIPLARVALEVGTAVLPPDGSKFSPRRFTQPQLPAVLCLMRFEGWTYRETCVRLAEPRDLREVLGLRKVPHRTTLQKFLARLPEGVLQRALEEVARRLLPPGPPAITAADATGLRTGRASVYFIRRLRQMGIR